MNERIEELIESHAELLDVCRQMKSFIFVMFGNGVFFPDTVQGPICDIKIGDIMRETSTTIAKAEAIAKATE